MEHRLERDDITIRPLAADDEADTCARMMADTDPWQALGRDVTACRRVVSPQHGREIYVAISKATGDLVGVIVISLTGVFVGYIQTLCVAGEWRSRGVGEVLLGFAEERIFTTYPNVFLCVSSFNAGAQRFYERLGYEKIGEVNEFLIRGASELILRKTKGSWSEFIPKPAVVEAKDVRN